jgi:hypothetical protein
VARHVEVVKLGIPWMTAVLLAALFLLLLPGSGAAVIPLESARKLHFQQLDKNKDGKISRQEYLAPWSGPHRYIGEQQFREFDKNQDGYITPDEYIPSLMPKPTDKK